jgi:hypothetical protein
VVLAAAAEVLGADRLRSCFFALTPDRRLVPAGFHGRAEQPRSIFLPGTVLGDFALDLLDRREDLFCPDVRDGTPPGWRPSGHAYRTFLAVPVATESRAFGISPSVHRGRSPADSRWGRGAGCADQGTDVAC